MHGELWLGGSGVARGYPGLPARTAERFTPDPFAGIRGARLYRTGDLARWRGDGQLEFFGRLDQQVALRGFRIEPGEVEAMILRHGGLREAVVTIAEHRTGQARLVAWLVPREEGKLEIDPLRTFLRQQLPSYLVPTVYVPLTDLPRLANGKIDRGALGRRPLPASEGGRTAWAAPATPVEELVAAIFAEVLGADDSVSERIGLHDDFFELGGHSLLAIRLSSRLREAFGVELPVQAIFEAPTVADLAARLDAASRDNELPPAPPIRAAVHSTPPTSFAQQRLWFLESWQPGRGVYNMAGALDLEGALDVRALAGALAAIVARHEALRTRFAMVDGEPVQRITAPPAPGLALCDLSGLRERHRRTEIERLCAQEARRSFDLAHEPLMRSLLVREAGRQHRLFVNLHHIVADGISLDILTGELGLLYDAGLTGRRAAVPALPVQYADYAAWQRQWLTAAVLEPRLNAWRQRLREVPVTLELPIDRPRPAVQSLQGGRQAWRLRRSATAALQALARRQGATLFIAVLAAFEAWLHRLSGQRAFTVGTPVANRVRPELEGLIGLFVNTVVVPADLGDAPTFRRLLGRCQRQALAAWADQELPFEKLVEAVDTERDPSRNPMFQAMLVLEPEGEAAPQLPGLDVRAVEIHNGGAKFDLLLSAAASQQRLEGSLEYSAALFDPVTVQRLAGYLETLIESALADPDRPLAQLSMLRRPQRFQLLFEWNDYRAALPETTLHGLFEAQVARSGSANALVAGTERWSYRRLDRESSRIARHLRQLGVGPEAIVGLFLERRPELVAALLGVLKAGGAYLPLDPEYPAQRVALTLADAGAAVVLTTTHLADRLPVEQPAVRLDREELAEGHPAGDVSGAALDGANLAYVIYTSGSTGRPKGVAMTHRNAAAMVGWATGVYSAAEMSSVLGATSICFDLSVFELFAPLSRGGTVVLAANALELTELPTADEVTLVNTVPSALTELLRAGPLPPSVRTVNLAGEPLTRKLTDAIYAGSRAQRVYNLYGPSEDTTYSTFTGVAQGE
ncbi:MAG: condensation domain-containing protein, partial [Acidobacteriota bacterium]